MLNPRKEPKRERRARSGEWRGEWRAESEDFLLRAHTKGHRRLCRRVIFNKHQKGPGIDNSESFLVQ